MRKYILLLIIFLSANLSFAQFSHINMEGGGAVTEILSTSDGNRLYARTDNGGLYRSDRTGSSWGTWQFMSNYATTIGGLIVQGIALHPSNPDIIYICCGCYYLDALDMSNIGIWKSVNGGVSWTHVNSSINFEGVLQWEKNGGECIIVDQTNPNNLYAGGRHIGGTDTQYNTIYRSNNAGDTWTPVLNNPTIRGNIATIVFDPLNSNIIWVGTHIEPGASSNYSVLYKVDLTSNTATEIPGFDAATMHNAIYRVAFNPGQSQVIPPPSLGYIAYGEGGSNTYGLMKTLDYGLTWMESTSDLLNPGTGYIGELNCISFFHKDAAPGYNFMVSRMNRQTDEMTSGIGNFTEWGMNTSGPYPKYFYSNYSYYDWGKNINQNQNPANYKEFYSSHAYGVGISTNKGASWKFMNNGINQTDNYNVVFEDRAGAPAGNIYMPMADLTMARIMDGGSSLQVHDYAREKCNPIPNYDSYISNATRFIKSRKINNTDYISYLLGGNNYQNETGVIFKTTDFGNSFSRITPNGIRINEPNHPLVDGIGMYDAAYDPNYNFNGETVPSKIMILVGGGSRITNPNTTPNNIKFGKKEDSDLNKFTQDNGRGIYISSDGGVNWSFKSNGIEEKTPEGTEYNIYVPKLFDYQKCLALDNNNSRYYAYFKGACGDNTYGAGFFYSDDQGENWHKASYFGKQWCDNGFLVNNQSRSNEVYLGMNSFIDDGGLWKGTYSGTNAPAFSPVSAGQGLVWKSVKCEDADGNRLAVFGRRTGDTFDKLYYSDNNGTTWSRLTSDAIKLPSITCVNIRKGFNELWISTGSQGILKYDLNGAAGINLNGTEIPEDFKLFQNYPNPFNPQTTIKIDTRSSEKISLEIYNTLGEKVETLFSGQLESGQHSFVFNASNYSSGVYFYKVSSVHNVAVKKMICLK